MQRRNKPEKLPNSDIDQAARAQHRTGKKRPAEIGGPKGPEPTRYGDWERRGRCIDF